MSIHPYDLKPGITFHIVSHNDFVDMIIAVSPVDKAGQPVDVVYMRASKGRIWIRNVTYRIDQSPYSDWTRLS